jgi:hypothetical protein
MSIIQDHFDTIIKKYNEEGSMFVQLGYKREMIGFIIALELSGNNIEANECKDKFDAVFSQSQ